ENGPQAPTNFIPIHVGQPYVDDGDIRLELLRHDDAARPIVGDAHLAAFLFEQQPHDVGGVVIVVDDLNTNALETRRTTCLIACNRPLCLRHRHPNYEFTAHAHAFA